MTECTSSQECLLTTALLCSTVLCQGGPPSSAASHTDGASPTSAHRQGGHSRKCRGVERQRGREDRGVGIMY